jgi:hypothetical protein
MRSHGKVPRATDATDVTPRAVPLLIPPRGLTRERREAPPWRGLSGLWSCGESNPGPVTLFQDFSGRSLLCFSRPPHSRRQGADGPSHLKVPAAPVTRATSSGSLDDASYRVESDPGLTDFGTRSGGEGEVGALVIGTYRFAGKRSRDEPASSARFSWKHDHRRNRSAPVVLSIAGPQADRPIVVEERRAPHRHSGGTARDLRRAAPGGVSRGAPRACPAARAGRAACRTPSCRAPGRSPPWRDRRGSTAAAG